MRRFLTLFPVWAPLAALAGYLGSGVVSAGRGAIVPLLMLVMLCMGLTLRPAGPRAISPSMRACGKSSVRDR